MEAQLTHLGLVYKIDEEDYKKIEGLTTTRKTKKNSEVVYVTVNIKGKWIPLHRYILGLTDPKLIVDHINRDGLDNRRENLRVVDTSTNCANCKTRVNNTTGLTGVGRQGRSYTSRLIFRGKRFCLGSYKSAKEAALARDKKVVELRGTIGVSLNFDLDYVLNSENPIRINKRKKEQRSYERPCKEDLHKKIWSMSSAKLAEEIGCTKTLILMWCYKENIPHPPKGFWVKIQGGKLEGQCCPLP